MNISFKTKGQIKTLRQMKAEKKLLLIQFNKNVKGSSSGLRKNIPKGHSNLHNVIKSTEN